MCLPERFLAAFGVAVAAMAMSPVAPEQRQSRAPDFAITTLDGRKISSTTLAGKTVVLDFWGTWCPPCKVATPSLVSLANKYAANQNFVMIGVSSDESRDERIVRDYISTHKMNWLQYLDAPPRLVEQFHIDDFPTYVVIDANGIVRERLLGWPRAAKGSTVPVGTTVLRALEDAVKKSLNQRKTR